MPTRLILFVVLFFSLLHAEYSLEKLCQIGIQNNPKIKSNSYRELASNSVHDQSIDQYKPHLNISGQYGVQNYDLGDSLREQHYQGKNFNYLFSLKQPIYNNQLLHAITDSEEKEKLSKLQSEDERAKLTTQILQVSVELLRQRNIIDILTKKESLLAKAYNNIKKKYDMKLASSSDVFQSLSMLQQSKSDVIKAKQNYDYNLFNLRLLTKVNDVEKYITPLHFNIPAIRNAFNKSNLKSIQKSINNNTRIKLERQTVQIAKVQIGLRDSARSPQLDAVLSYGDSDGTVDTTTRQNESRAVVTLNFPLYQGGFVDDSVQESKYLYYAAQSDAENIELNIKISMEKAQQNIKNGLESIIAEESATEASKKYFDGIAIAYSNGLASLTDAYLAEADYRDNELKLINSEADIVLSLTDIYYYSGKTSSRDIKELQQKFFK